MHRINADKLSQFTDKLILADIIPKVAVLKLSEISLLRIYNSCVSIQKQATLLIQWLSRDGYHVFRTCRMQISKYHGYCSATLVS